MADTNEGGSARLLDFFLLPFLSLCTCRRKKEDCDLTDIEHNRTIDKQPDVTPLVGTKDQEEKTDIEHNRPIDKQPEETPLVGTKDQVEKVNDAIASDRRMVTMVGSNDTQYYDASISHCEVSDIIHSINNHGDSSDQLGYNDLPLLPVLMICGYLRRNGRCTDIRNFRQTCRTFARGVNTFFEHSDNLPSIENIAVSFQDDVMIVEGDVDHVNYVMHPIGADQTLFRGTRTKWGSHSYFKGSFTAGDEEAIEKAVGSLCGPVKQFGMHFGNVAHVKRATEILRNVKFDGIRATFGIITDELASAFLALLDAQPIAPYVIMFCAGSELSDAPDFLNDLESVTSGVMIRQEGLDPILGETAGFWINWMVEMTERGYKVSCDAWPLDDELHHNLRNRIRQRPRIIEWRNKSH